MKNFVVGLVLFSFGSFQDTHRDTDSVSYIKPIKADVITERLPLHFREPGQQEYIIDGMPDRFYFVYRHILHPKYEEEYCWWKAIGDPNY